MLRIVTMAAFALLFAASTAHADRAAADACARKLSPQSKTIYDKSLSGVLSGQKPVDAVTAVARSMVMGGSMSRDTARPAAEAAGGCLRLAQ
ncbi:MAG TPA: hypothetical protein VG651_14520 [Stellaceae bacterium]|nr:hypothetical protein [Stellaceae bacterium]